MRFEPFMRVIDLLMISMLIGMIIWTFKVKYDSQVALKEVSRLEKQVAAKQVEIDLLKSDWSLLTNPARLEVLAERFGEQLQLKPVDPTQLTNLDKLPPLRQEFDPEKLETDFVEIPGQLITGSIKKVQGGNLGEN